MGQLLKGCYDGRTINTHGIDTRFRAPRLIWLYCLSNTDHACVVVPLKATLIELLCFLCCHNVTKHLGKNGKHQISKK